MIEAPHGTPWPQGTAGLLDTLRHEKGLTSDYQLARHLHVPQTTISNYRNKKSFPDEVMACRIADELGLPRAYVLACVAAERAERAKNNDVAETWRDLAKKMGLIGGTLALVVAAFAALGQFDISGFTAAMGALALPLNLATHYAFIAISTGAALIALLATQRRAALRGAL